MNSPANAPSGRRQALLELTNRLEVLLRQEPDPQAWMKYLGERLREAGIAPDLREDHPMAFCLDLNANLEALYPGAYHYPLQPLGEYQSAEELVLDILPSRDDHDF